MSFALALKLLASSIMGQRQPMNITRADGETNVFIPCPFEFRSTPSIWRIRGMEYTAATIPPVYSITPGGLFINTVHVCMNQTSFQCIDTSDNALAEQLSDIGILTVSSQDTCAGKIHQAWGWPGFSLVCSAPKPLLKKIVKPTTYTL